MRFLMIFIVHFVLAGCSALPDSARVTTFGNAVTSSATVMQEAVALSGRLQVHDEAELASQAVIRHGPVAFPVRTDPLLPADSVALRMQMLRTLGEYGKALAEAADKGNVERLEAAAAKLGGAALAVCRGRIADNGAGGRPGDQDRIAQCRLSARQRLCGGDPGRHCSP
jgi:hypothetical protein